MPKGAPIVGAARAGLRRRNFSQMTQARAGGRRKAL